MTRKLISMFAPHWILNDALVIGKKISFHMIRAHTANMSFRQLLPLVSGMLSLFAGRSAPI